MTRSLATLQDSKNASFTQPKLISSGHVSSSTHNYLIPVVITILSGSTTRLYDISQPRTTSDDSFPPTLGCFWKDPRILSQMALNVASTSLLSPRFSARPPVPVHYSQEIADSMLDVAIYRCRDWALGIGVQGAMADIYIECTSGRWF